MFLPRVRHAYLKTSETMTATCKPQTRWKRYILNNNWSPLCAQVAPSFWSCLISVFETTFKNSAAGEVVSQSTTLETLETIRFLLFRLSATTFRHCFKTPHVNPDALISIASTENGVIWYIAIIVIFICASSSCAAVIVSHHAGCHIDNSGLIYCCLK